MAESWLQIEQVGLRVFKTVARAHGHEFLLPIEDVDGSDLVHALVPQEREDLVFDHVGPGLARGLPKAHLRILRIDLVEIGERHSGGALHALQELVLPITRFLLGLEPAFGLLLGFARPVLVVALDVMCVPFEILANGHRYHLDSALPWARPRSIAPRSTFGWPSLEQSGNPS